MRTFGIISVVFLFAGVAATSCSKESKREPQMSPAAGQTAYPTSTRQQQQWHSTQPMPESSATQGTMGAAPMDTTDQGAVRSTLNVQAAIGPLARTSCDREARCNNIGADKKHKSFSDCESSMTDDFRNSLKDCV